MTTPTLINEPAAIEALVHAVADAPLVAIDTEFIRESTYHARLCLLQIGTPSLTGCVDCCASAQLGPLFEELATGKHTWLLHSARQDIEVIEHYAGVRPSRVIDTQVAAALTGHAPQISLQNLLAAILGVHLEKAFTRTDWSARPLPPGAVQYAIEDVVHLAPLWHSLETRLTQLGRLEWLHEDCTRMLKHATVPDPSAIWKRLKGVQALDTATQTAAMSLIAWREEHAQRLDRPRRWIMSDPLLMQIAQHRPASQEALAKLADMPQRLAARSGDEILDAVDIRNQADAKTRVDEALDPVRPDKDALKALQRQVRDLAAELGIEVQVLATRRDLETLLAGVPPVHLVDGWRATALAGIQQPAA